MLLRAFWLIPALTETSLRCAESESNCVVQAREGSWAKEWWGIYTTAFDNGKKRRWERPIMHSTRFGLAGGLDAVLILFIYGVLARLSAYLIHLIHRGICRCQICRNPLATNLQRPWKFAVKALHKFEYMKVLRGISRLYGRSGESRDPSLIVDNHR